MALYHFNRKELFQKEKERYSKEKAAEYYLKNKEAMKAKNRYKNLSKKKKNKIKEYQKKKKKKKNQQLIQYEKEALQNK